MRPRRSRLALIALIFAASGVYAQELEPRAYSNTPIGLNFVIAGYAYAEGGLATDPAVPLENAELRTKGPVFAYARSLDVWGRSGKFDILLPYAWVSGTAQFAGEPRERDVAGFGDPRLRVSVNLYGAPALSLEEFGGYQQDLIIGASLQVSAPLGQYSDRRLVNIGTNRWAVKPELGVSKSLGRWTLEFAAGATLYSDNNDFLGNRKREQDPIYSMQGHLLYSFRSGIWAAVNGTYYTGGRTTVDGVASDDLQENSRLGLTLALPVNRRNSIKLYGSSGVSTRTGTDFDAIGIAWQYRWGGGI